jgi:hypothetical protein
MRRLHRIIVSCVAAAALLVACAGASRWLGPDVEPTLVQFTYRAVNPQTVRIPPDGNVTWENAAPDTIGFVVLATNIAPSFRCTDLHPYFEKKETVYRSLPLTDEESERVQLPCPLAPGSYDYEIWLIGTGFGEFSADREPQQILRAKIVVE